MIPTELKAVAVELAENAWADRERYRPSYDDT